MRTLRQIEKDALEKAKVRADELCDGTGEYFCITKNEIIAMQVNTRFGEKYCEMHALLKEVVAFLGRKWDGPDGGWDEDTAKKELKKKIAAL